MCTPNVIIAGAPKCGTSSIFEWLSEHPEVCGSTVKETCFFLDEEEPSFNKEANYHQHGMEGYRIYFKHCKHKSAKVILEATTEYLYQQTALEVLPLLKPCPKILFVLRKPSERVYSVYQFLLNNVGTLDKSVSFNEFVSMFKNDSNVPLKGRVSIRNAIERSVYVKYIPEWVERFCRENVYVLLFEHLRKDPIEFMKNISSYIGIDGTFWNHYSFSVKNVSYRVKNQTIHRLKRRAAKFVPKVAKERVFKRAYHRLNVKKPLPKNAEDCNVLEALDIEFSPYNDELSRMLNIDLSVWK